MKRKLPVPVLCTLLLLCLCLAACTSTGEVMPSPTPPAGQTSTPTAQPTPVATPNPEPTTTPTPIPTEPVTDPESILASVEGFYHRPFEELPPELRDSLEWDGKIYEYDAAAGNTVEIGGLEMNVFPYARLRCYTGTDIILITTEATEAFLQERLERQLSLPEGDEARTGTDEELRAEYALEKGREWLHSVIITGDSYATLPGLKVGSTLEEADALGYDLRQWLNDNGDGQNSFGNTIEEHLSVYVKNGVVEKMELGWGIGRFVGKYFEL